MLGSALILLCGRFRVLSLVYGSTEKKSLELKAAWPQNSFVCRRSMSFIAGYEISVTNAADVERLRWQYLLFRMNVTTDSWEEWRYTYIYLIRDRRVVASFQWNNEWVEKNPSILKPSPVMIRGKPVTWFHIIVSGFLGFDVVVHRIATIFYPFSPRLSWRFFQVVPKIRAVWFGVVTGWENLKLEQNLDWLNSTQVQAGTNTPFMIWGIEALKQDLARLSRDRIFRMRKANRCSDSRRQQERISIWLHPRRRD